MIYGIRKSGAFFKLSNLSSVVFGTTHADILGRDRSEPLVSIRAILFVAARLELGHVFSEIAKEFNRDHGTIIHHVKKHESRMSFTVDENGKRRFADKDYYESYNLFKKILNEQN